jgi:DNA-directed RNA polymerase subunit M/transcription elongation factor TFIIS
LWYFLLTHSGFSLIKKAGMVLIDFVKLSMEIATEIRDPKLLSKIQDLQKLTAKVQVEFAELTEQRLQTLTENATLKVQMAEYEKQVVTCDKCEFKRAPVGESFVEFRGGLFKARPGGGYHDAVFCPKCKKAMVSYNKIEPFTCEDCRTAVDFNGRELWRVMQNLPR